MRNYGINQFGFRRRSSTTCAILAIIDDLTKQLDNDEIKAISLLSFDATKAFDSVPHDLLINRLLNSDLPVGFTHWYKHYLTGRKQFVEYRDQTSRHSTVTSGVPQGATLSPAIFCIFMAPLQTLFSMNVIYKFADDLALLLCHNLDVDNSENCRKEISNVLDWCAENGIKINSNKTQRLLYNKGNYLPSEDCFMSIKLDVKPIKLLGVYFDTSLSWSFHVNFVIKKASKNLHLLRILKRTLAKKQLTQLYSALVQSILEYGSSVYVGSIKSSDKSKISKTVSRAHRIICGPNCSQNCLPNLDLRRMNSAYNLYTSALNDNAHILHDRMPTVLPSGRRLSVPISRKTRRINSFFPFMTIFHNQNSQ